MAGKEIDTGIVSCIIVIMIRIKASVQITGTGNTPCSVPGIPEISLQEGTEAVTVTAIPFSPSAAGRERTNLIQPAGIPGFCDQFYVPKDRIFRKIFQKRRLACRRTVFISPQNAGQIKPETVHMIFDRPIPQALKDHLLHYWMITVQCVSASTEIIIPALRSQNIIDAVIESFK